MNMKIN